MEENKTYYRRLDVVRDLSCILVLLYHLNIVQGGFLAVCTFFTLSGYLSCISALKNQNFSVKSYYIKRIKKLYFPLIVVVFITVIMAKLNPIIHWLNLKTETFSILFGYNNIWQLNANLDYFTRNINSPFTHMWYISILLQFDLIFPLVVNFLKKIERKTKKQLSTVGVVLLTIVTTLQFYHMSKTQNMMAVYYNSFARSFSIFFGILLAIVHYKYNFKLSHLFSRYNTMLFIIYSIALVALCMLAPASPDNYAIYMIVTTIISTRLIEYSVLKLVNKEKQDKSMKALSQISYEVYLVQYPVIFFMKYSMIPDSVKVCLIIVLTFIISFILHVLINLTFKNTVLKMLKMIFFSSIIIVGSYLVVMEKDYRPEMKALEDRLNENSKIIEEKHNEYLNTTNEEQKDWNSLIEKAVKEENDIKKVSKEKKKGEDKPVKKEKTKSNLASIIREMPVVGIGDSVLLDASKEFYHRFPKGYFDGKISRTVSGGEEVIINLKKKGKLGNTVILCLSTNGDYSEKKNKELMKLLGNRRIYWINAIGADDPKFNSKFKKFASNYPNVHIVEWDKVVKRHPEYLEPDKIHPNHRGGKVMVKLVYDTIYNDYLKEYNNNKES